MCKIPTPKMVHDEVISDGINNLRKEIVSEIRQHYKNAGDTVFCATLIDTYPSEVQTAVKRELEEMGWTVKLNPDDDRRWNIQAK